MGNCLVTKLKGTVNNDNLRRFNAVVIHVKASDVLTIGTVTNGKSVATVISGNGYFGTAAGTIETQHLTTFPLTTWGKLYFSNTDCVIKIENVNNLNYMSSSLHSSFNIKDVNYVNCSIVSFAVSGNITENISSSIIRLSDSPELTGDVTGHGNIAFYAPQSKLWGDFTELVKSYDISSGLVDRTSPFKNLKTPANKNVIVDMSQANENVYAMETSGASKSFTAIWTINRSSSYPVISLDAGDKPFDFGNYVDAMLINQAECDETAFASRYPTKVIKVLGNRTSASDTAVTTLKGKGFTIIVNGTTL